MRVTATLKTCSPYEVVQEQPPPTRIAPGATFKEVSFSSPFSANAKPGYRSESEVFYLN